MNGLGVYAASLENSGVHVVDCTSSGFRVRGYPHVLISGLREFEPDILHAHSGTWFPAAVACAVLGGAPLVFTDHGRYPPEPRLRLRLERWCGRRTAQVVAVSSALSEYVKAELRLESCIIENGVDLASHVSTPGVRHRLRATLGLTDPDVLVLAVGRLAAVKNHQLLLDAVAVAGQEVPKLHLAIAGHGPLEGSLKRAAKASQMADRIHFLGFVDNVAGWLAAADAFALTSETEGLPISLLEAMAGGLPVIATSVGGIPHALGDPPCGMLSEPGDVEAIADSLVRLAREPALRTDLGRQAALRAERYSLERMTTAYEQLYSAVQAGVK